MLIDRLCSPALIYLAFSIIQLILDISQGKYRLAIAKLFICLLFTYLLNVLCEQRLTQLSWIIISLPFLFMGYMSLLLVYALGFSDINGNDINNNEDKDDKDDEEEDDNNNNENLINNIFTPTAFESFALKKRQSVHSAPKNAENINIDAVKLETGKV
tara:strand:- start:4596 stop:5069 length:474 start_codon:yes stop_codon:yes gene_type:complete